MMEESKMALSYPMIVAKLQQLCEDECSGTLMIMGAIGQTTRIHLTDGAIVALMMKDKKGLEVVQLLPKIQVSRMDFVHGLPCSVTTPLPPTSVLLAQLEAQATASPLPTRAAGSTAGKPLDTESQELLIQTLTHYIGPMAKVFSKRVLQTKQDLDEVLCALEESIPEAAEARRFLTEIRSKLAVHA